MKQLVIMPGGFHPFHAGHLALYQSAEQAFPGADVKVAATNDTSARPFPFKLKEKLAQLAGVPPGKFYQVKSPFRAEEITKSYDPATTQLIFVRSEKDATKPPVAGAIKKDGTPAYLQPISDDMAPMTQHAYMAYLPTVEFGPGMTSATEIRSAWPTLSTKRKTALVMSLYPATQSNPKLAATVVKMLDTAMGAEVAEASIPQPGPSSGAPKQFGSDAKIQTRQMTVKDIISSVPGVPYYNNVVDDWDAKDYSWGVTKKVIEYATYLKDHPETVTQLPPAIVLNGKFEDGAHRVSAIWLLQQRMDPKNPLWKNAKLNVQFVKQDVAEGGAESSWSKGPDKITLQDILELTKHIEQINLPINDNLKSKLLHWDGNPEEMERVNQVTVSKQFPILIMVDEQGQIAWILDGNHRLHKAIQSQAKTIPAKLIRPSNLNDKAKKIFRIKEQGVNEAGNQTNDSELNAIKTYAKRHYPNLAADPESAFDKWVQRSLMHSNVDDHEMDQKIRRMAADIANLKTKIQSLKQQPEDSADYLDESR